MIKRQAIYREVPYFSQKLLLLLTLTLSTLIFFGVFLTAQDKMVYFTSLSISLISIVMMIVLDPFPYSLNKMFYLFFLIFMGLAPVVQFESNIVFWGGHRFSAKEYFVGNSILLLVLLVYSVTYYLALYSGRKKNMFKRSVISASESETAHIELNRKSLYLAVIASTILTLYFHKFNLTNLLIRFLSDKAVGESIHSQPISLIYHNFIRPMAGIALVITKMSRLGKKSDYFLLTVLTLITIFPLGVARYYAAAIYIPIVLVFFEGKFRTNFLFLNIIVILALVVVFPFLGSIRNEAFFETWNSFRVSFLNNLNTADYDSYQMYLKVVTENFIPGPKQLLTVLLFFVPREWFPSKSVGSGHLVAQEFGYSFSNISMNFFGEGFVNFGYLGIFLFAIVIGVINARYDRLYWTSNLTLWKKTYYNLFIGLEFFILRGDLLSSFAYSMGFLVSTVFLYYLVFKPRDKKCRNVFVDIPSGFGQARKIK